MTRKSKGRNHTGKKRKRATKLKATNLFRKINILLLEEIFLIKLFSPKTLRLILHLENSILVTF